MSESSRRHRHDLPGMAAFAVVAAIVALAPLYRGGNRPLALLVLELLALAGLGLALLRGRARERIPVAAAVVAGLVAAIPLLQLVPVPLALWGALPGREAFVPTLRDLAGATSHAVSVIPFETEYAALALLPTLVVFLLALQLRLPQVVRIMQVLVVVAVVEAIIGLVQYGALGGGAADVRASGTFANPNHFAGFLLMVLPVAVMGLAVEIGDRTRERIRGRGIAGALRRAVASRGIKVLAAVAIIVLLLTAIVFSRSRAAIALAALGLAITTFTAAPRIGGPRAYGVLGTVLAIVVGLAAAIGLLPVLDRFAQLDVLEDDRFAMVVAAIEMAGHYFPTGSGVGTFAALYPPFQPPEILTFVHRAHNDFVEWVVEGGIVALIALALGLATFVARLVMLAREPDKHRVHYLQVGAAVGVLLMALHGLVDFNLRIPSNAIVFALLAGVLLSRHQSVQLQEHRRDRRARVATAPIPVVPVPQLDPDSAALVHAIWAGARNVDPVAAPLRPALAPAEAWREPDLATASASATRNAGAASSAPPKKATP